ADENYLWMNRGDLHFEEQAGWLGVAVSGRGSSQSCMGTDLADIDGDLDLDLFAANFGKEASILYVRGADGFYEDRTWPSGLGAPSYLFTGFGARFFDVDKDGDFDLMVVNGHIVDDIKDADPSQTFEQVPHLYQNRGNGTFDEVGATISPFFRKQNLGRGLATGDLDDDGDLDVVVLENDHPLVLLENRCANGNHWIGFALQGTKSSRDAIGATVTIECAGKKQIEPVIGSCSYLSWSDLRVFFGVGAVDPAKVTASATVRWPSGAVQQLSGLALDRYHAVVEPGPAR
ncbi:MAG TPA: FG-GAP-like repeat-containing protein, partial [Planctomycetota bacterium]|nr:FG-GAP-like repeat-containing protein [Planctomycetota bacterium]